MSVYLTADIPKDARMWRNTLEVRSWCRQYTAIDENQHKKWLEKISFDPTIKMFGIAKDDIEIGVCGLTSINHVNQSAEFSLYIAPKYQRKGLGKLAMKALLTHGFNDFNLNRIWGETFFGNPALKMFSDLGMKTEGRMRETYFRDGKWIDSFIVSILRREFR